jgi:hypothetical protein
MLIDPAQTAAVLSLLEELDDDVSEPAAAASPPRIVRPSAAAAARRRVDAERKRLLRAERIASGMPDQRAVDAALASAMAEVLRRDGAHAAIARRGTTEGIRIPLQNLFAIARDTLEERGFTRVNAVRALEERLFASP